MNAMFIEIAICLWACSLENVKGQDLDVDNCIDNGLNVYVFGGCILSPCDVHFLLDAPNPFKLT